jgi:mutator protein MutT
MKHVTLVFLRRDNEILLAMKKRGFGVNKWNGAGGKVEEGETPPQAAVREAEEEINVTPRNLQKVGEIDFYLTEEPNFNHYAHIYTATEWTGEPQETEEMRPQWFKISDVPYDKMWGDDKYWLPDAIAGKRFKAMYKLDADDNIVESDVKYLTQDEEF